MHGHALADLKFVTKELALWVGLYGAYLSARELTIGGAREAFANSARLVDLERAVGLFQEERLQDVFGATGATREFFAAYYMLGFAPLLLVSLVWLGLRHRPAYEGLRTALLVSLAAATVVFALYPAAPPRLVDGLGIADTVGLSGHDEGSFAGIRFNPYAAMPSMHVGWSVLLGLYGARAASRRIVRAFFALHPLVMAATVTATGNHYLVDALVGAALALAAVAAIPAGRALARPIAVLVPAPARGARAIARAA
jgi:hypothetical protein